MDIFDNCRICLHNINHEPIKMTRLILKFLEKGLQLTNVTKSNPQIVNQNLCASCFNKISEFQDFHEQCKDSDRFWKTQFDNLKETIPVMHLTYEDNVLLSLTEDTNSLEADTTVPSTIELHESDEDHDQTIQDNIGKEDDKGGTMISISPANMEDEEVKIEKFNSIDLTDWTDDVETNNNDVDIQIIRQSDEKDDNQHNAEEIIEYEYQIQEEEIEAEMIVHQHSSSESSVDVDYHPLVEATNTSENTMEKTTEEQIETSQSTFFMKTIVDESGKLKMSYICQHCDKSFNRIYDIESHYNIHKGVKPYTCHVCGKSFRQKNILTTHQTLHFGKKVECGQCGKKFARRSQLILHYRMHRDEKPFVCDFEGCQAAFRQRKQLMDHSFLHTGEKSFQCSTCSKQFYTKKRLQDHMYKVHSVHRYCCNLCEKAFLKPHMLKHHMTSAHNIEVADVSHLKTTVDGLKNTSKKSRLV